MNYVPNQNGKILEKTLACSNSDAMKTKLRGLPYFKITLPFLQVLQKSVPIPLPPCLIHYRLLGWPCRSRHHIQISKSPVQTLLALG